MQHFSAFFSLCIFQHVCKLLRNGPQSNPSVVNSKGVVSIIVSMVQCDVK